MFLRNTSKYPDDEVRRLVEFAAEGFDLRRVCVNVKGTQYAYRGRAYGSVPREYSNAPKTARRLVVVCVGDQKHFPHKGLQYFGRTYKDTNKWPVLRFDTWQEAVVAVATHEFGHIYQFQNKLPCSESFCERKAAAALERYRGLQATAATEEKVA